MNISFHYRIYPAWFRGNDAGAMSELARETARQRGWLVSGIVVTGHGFDNKSGHYRDFTVSYVDHNVNQRSTK